jgi:hypothetical protein
MMTVALRPAPRVLCGRLNASEFELVRKWLDFTADVLVDNRNGVIERTEDAMDAMKTLSEAERP